MKTMSIALAGASLLAVSSASTPAWSQPVATASAADEATLGEIVVTARRRSESLQDVPQVVDAVTGDALARLQIKDMKDIQSVVSGLSITTVTRGDSANAEIRGVSYNATTAAAPTVATYINETPVQSNFIFATLFDVGQIEVLRGPQGTTRGVAAPSGAITVTTRKPDLGQFGGYVDATVTDLQRRNVNGAVNIPVIRDVLGIRIAGAMDQNDFDGVRSLYSRLRPSETTSAIRTSVSFEPSDAFNANLMYSHMNRSRQMFIPVAGNGFAGAPALGLGATPPIGDLDRVGVQDVPGEVRQQYDVVTLQLDSRVWGQHLSYVGGYSMQRFRNTEERDTGQNLIGVPFYATTLLRKEDTSHEIRLSSDPAPGRFFDYVVGVYYGWQETHPTSYNLQTASFLPPAFGAPAAPSLAAFNPIFQIPLRVLVSSTAQDTSAFGSLTLHLGSKTELTGGLRHLWTVGTAPVRVTLENGLTAVPPGVPCQLAGLQPGPAPGICVVPTAAVVARPGAERFHEEHTIYNVSLSHRFTSDLLVYGNVGTSYRPQYASTGLLNAGNDPILATFGAHPSEKSRGFEVGVKWSFLERRGRLNAAIYRQKFKDLPVYTAPIPYVANNGASTSVQLYQFTADPDAIVEGFDVDAAFQITPNWTISGQVSYSDGRATTDMPCNDSNFDGSPDNGLVTSVSQFPPGVLVALCPGASISTSPYWNATVQTEYLHPVTDGVDGYVRGLFTYYPKNARATPARVIDNYGLLNFYTGVRAKDGAWEAGLFVRNAFNTQKLTFIAAGQTNNINGAIGTYPSLVHLSGYFEKTLTPRREVGINVRYAFGSR